LSELGISAVGKISGIDFLKTGTPFMDRPVLESSLESWNSSRRFYEMNLGDPGFTIPVEFGGVRVQRIPYEFMPSTEYLRRFLIKRTADVQTVNLAPNKQFMKGLYPEEYFIDFSVGSDYSRYPYYSDLRGYSAYGQERYSIQDIAVNMAPFSTWTKSIVSATGLYDEDYHRELLDRLANINSRIKTEPYRFLGGGDGSNLEPYLPMMKLKEAFGVPGYPTLDLEDSLSLEGEELPQPIKRKRNKYTLPERLVGATWEVFTHGHSIRRFWWEKGWEQKTALEEYEERGIYGINYAQWEHPISTFAVPMMWQTLSENPLSAGLRMGSHFSLFTKGPTYKLISGTIGGLVGLGGAGIISGIETVTGKPFIPPGTLEKRELENTVDTLAYLRGDPSSLGYLTGEQPWRSGRPPLERRLFEDFRKTEGNDREVLLALLPERLAAQLSRERYDAYEVRDRAVEEFNQSEYSKVEYALDKAIPIETIKAALINRAGANPYLYNVYPNDAAVGQLIEENYQEENLLPSNYDANMVFGTKGMTSRINSIKGMASIRVANMNLLFNKSANPY